MHTTSFLQRSGDLRTQRAPEGHDCSWLAVRIPTRTPSHRNGGQGLGSFALCLQNALAASTDAWITYLGHCCTGSAYITIIVRLCQEEVKNALEPMVGGEYPPRHPPNAKLPRCKSGQSAQRPLRAHSPAAPAPTGAASGGGRGAGCAGGRGSGHSCLMPSGIVASSSDFAWASCSLGGRRSSPIDTEDLVETEAIS
jgi:hypothetical protein